MIRFKEFLRSQFGLLLVALLLLGVTFYPAVAQDSPEDVARALIAAEDTNNVDAAVAEFADDAVVTLPPPFGVLDTPDKIRAWQQELADGHFRLEPINIQADGNVVTWTGNVSLDTFRSLGIASMSANWQLDIEDGKVKTFDFSFTPEALTALQAGATVAALVGAEAANDVDAAVAQFAPDAVVTLADGSVFNTPDGIRGWQQVLADGHFRLEPVARYVEGNTVYMYGEVAWDTFRQLGLPTVGGMWTIVVVDGKVETFDFSFTPAGAAAFQAALAAMATPEATASS